ncbi:MAG: hypothetical protein FJ333_05570 [Sphingomonadales bacterium]|nr:hypothetical protein [Sphingomonadales bacterium]
MNMNVNLNVNMNMNIKMKVMIIAFIVFAINVIAGAKCKVLLKKMTCASQAREWLDVQKAARLFAHPTILGPGEPLWGSPGLAF